MHLPRNFRSYLPVLFLALPALLASCDDHPTCRGACESWHTEYPDPVSPANVLEILRQSYVARDLDMYVPIFAADFVFLRNPQDTGGAPELPAAWGVAEEREAAHRMFVTDTVDAIELAFTVSEPVPQPDSLTRVEVTNVRLVIHTREPDGTPVNRGFTGGADTFYFRKYPQETRNGKPIWRITRWEDHGPAFWWEIKAFYL